MKILFDENVPYKFVEGLKLIEQSNGSKLKAEVFHPRLIGKEGVPDYEIIAIAKDATIVTFDKDFKHFKTLHALLKQHNVGVVLFRLAKKSDYWTIVTLIINNWEQLKAKIDNSTRPFAYEINNKGITSLSF